MSDNPIIKYEHEKALVRRVLTMNPSMTVAALKERLQNASTPILIGINQLHRLVADIRSDRIKEVELETKDDIYAQIKDTVEWVNNQLRAIADEEKLVYMALDSDGKPKASPETRIFAQNNRIKALNSVVENLIKLVNLKMDLGIIERKLGTADFQITDMLSALKKIRNGDYTVKLDDVISKISDGAGGEVRSEPESAGSSDVA